MTAVRTGWRSRKLVVVAVVIVLVAAAAAAILASRGNRPLPQGPVNVAAKDSASSPFYTGKAGSASWMTVFNYGRETAVVDSVRAVGVTPGLVVQHVYLVGAGRPTYGYCCTTSWPPTAGDRGWSYDQRLLREPRGVEIRPNSSFAKKAIMGANIVWVLRADRPGRYAFKGVEIRYHVGDKHYRRVLTNAFTMCVANRFKRCQVIRGYSAEEAAKL